MGKQETTHRHGLDQFEDWANDMEFFAMWGEIEYYEDGTKADDEWIEWVPEAVCKTEELAKIVCEGYADEATKTKVGTRYDVDFHDFLGKMREDGCIAVFDADDSEEPLAITFGTGNAIAQHLEKHGKAAVLETPLAEERPAGDMAPDSDDAEEDIEFDEYIEPEFDEFVEWIDQMSFFVLVQDEEDAWLTVAACRTETAVEIVQRNLAIRGFETRTAMPASVDRDAFLDDLQEDACLAIFDAVENESSEDLEPIDEKGLPFVVTNMDPAPIVCSIWEQGNEAFVVTFDDDSELMFALNWHFVDSDFERWVQQMPLIVTDAEEVAVAACREDWASDIAIITKEGRSLCDGIPFDARGKALIAVFDMDEMGWLRRDSLPVAVLTDSLTAARIAESIEQDGRYVAVEMSPSFPVGKDAALDREGLIHG